MSTLLVEVAGWPPHPQLRARRWAQRLVVGITDQLDGLGRGHRLLVELLASLEQHTPDRLVDAIGEVDRALVTTVDTVALLDLARVIPDVHALLRQASQQRSCALVRMRRLCDAHRLGLAPTLAHTRTVLAWVGREITAAGRALALADATLTAWPAPVSQDVP